MSGRRTTTRRGTSGRRRASGSQNNATGAAANTTRRVSNLAIRAAYLNPQMFPTQNLTAIAATGRSGQYWAGRRLEERIIPAGFQLHDKLEEYFQRQIGLQRMRGAIRTVKVGGKAYKNYEENIKIAEAWMRIFSRQLYVALQDPIVQTQINHIYQSILHIHSGAATPLMVAIDIGNHAFVQLLLDAGADPNQPFPVHGLDSAAFTTPLAYTAQHYYNRNDTHMYEILLTHGADINARTSFGQTVLDTLEFTARQNPTEAVRNQIAWFRARGAMTAAELAAGTA
jgi:hypothetical protein